MNVEESEIYSNSLSIQEIDQVDTDFIIFKTSVVTITNMKIENILITK